MYYPGLISGRHARAFSDAKGRPKKRAQPPRVPCRGRQDLFTRGSEADLVPRAQKSVDGMN